VNVNLTKEQIHNLLVFLDRVEVKGAKEAVALAALYTTFMLARDQAKKEEENAGEIAAKGD